MSKKVKANYRKICQDHCGYSDDQMLNMDVHHIDGNRNNNDPENLQLVSIEEHKRIHGNDFVGWARTGSELGNEAFRQRLKNCGPTLNELNNRKKLIERCKSGLHRTPHTADSKKLISEKKKQLLSNPKNHPMWGNSTYILTDPTGKDHVVGGGFTAWCKERGLVPSNMIKVSNGERTTHRGWKARKLD
jgi:hypothetical protein